MPHRQKNAPSTQISIRSSAHNPNSSGIARPSVVPVQKIEEEEALKGILPVQRKEPNDVVRDQFTLQGQKANEKSPVQAQYEAWHVVQQKQARERPTIQLRGNTPIVTGNVLQPVWEATPQDGLFSWDTVIEGMKWYYLADSGTLYFEIPSSAHADDRVQEYAGAEHAQNYDNWILLWNRMKLLSTREVDHRLVGVELGKKNGFTADETQALIDFTDGLGSKGIQYLLDEFAGRPQIPKRLQGTRRGVPIHEIIGREVGRAEARSLEPERVSALLKIRNRIQLSGAVQVLMLGGSKDFVFPFVITGGEATAYHMVSGELGNIEAIRSTIARYAPQNPAVSIQKTEIMDGVNKFTVMLKNQRTFYVVSYDMLYDDFFQLKEQLGGELGIPAQFHITMDQMSWMNSLPDEDPTWLNYSASLKHGGLLVSDPSYGGDFAWVLDLLGLQKVPIAWEDGEYFGYLPANVYVKNKDANATPDAQYLYNASLLFHRAAAFVFSEAKRLNINLDTSEGLGELSAKYSDQGGKLISELRLLVGRLTKYEKEPNPFRDLILSLENKIAYLEGGLESEQEQKERAEEEQFEKERSEREARGLTATLEIDGATMWTDFKAEGNAYYNIGNVYRYMLQKELIVEHRRQKVKYVITDVTKGKYTLTRQ